MKFPRIKLSQYLPKPSGNFGGNINVKVDLCNYATKTDLKNVTHVDTSDFVLKTNWASLKTEINKLDIDKLAPVPVDLIKLSDVVKNDVLKKTVFDKLAGKVNNSDTSDFVLKTKHQTDKTELEKKIPDVTDFIKKTKLTESEKKIPGVSSLVKKTNYDTKISELEKKLADHNHDKYITTPEFNTLDSDVFNARLAQANLIAQIYFDAKLSNLNRKITASKSKHLFAENELKKLQTFDVSYFIGKIHFEEDGTQNCLVFQPMYRYFKRIAGVGNSNYIYYWQSKRFSDEKIILLKCLIVVLLQI